MTGIFGRGEFVQDYLALRESRHITGRTVVTYHDVMAGRAFPDAILWCKSNVDIKGMASSRAVLCGYVEASYFRNFEMSIPYAALTPVGLTNLLVVGKAYAITHDGLGLARMQPDMIQLGTVAGVALAQACGRVSADSTRVPATEPGDFPVNLHDLDVGCLQERLMAMGLLLPGDFPTGPEDERVPPETDEALIDLVDRIVECPPEPNEWARLFMIPDRAAARLRAVAGAVELMRPATAQLLCALGDRAGADVLLRELDALIANGLPGMAGRQRHDMPDHGWAPRAVHLLNALAECGERRLIARLDIVLAHLELDRSVSDYRFCYVHAFTYAGERLAAVELIPLLQRLAGDPAICGASIARGQDPRLTQDHIAERYAYLELCLARALARCGSPGGYETLIAYTGDMRLYLARSARAELCELSGIDAGYDRAEWGAWLAAATATGLVPIPYTGRLA